MFISENISIKLNQPIEEVINTLETINQSNNVKLAKYADYDICLEFSNNQEDKPKYLFLGNIVNNELIGNVYNANYLKFKNNLDWKTIVSLVLILLFDLFFIFGVPFLTFYLTTRKMLVAFDCGLLALLFVVGYYIINEIYQIYKYKNFTIKYFEDLVKTIENN